MGRMRAPLRPGARSVCVTGTAAVILALSLGGCSSSEGAPGPSTRSGAVAPTPPAVSPVTYTLPPGWETKPTPSDPAVADAYAAGAAAKSFLYMLGDSSEFACDFLTTADGQAPMEADAAQYQQCQKGVAGIGNADPGSAQKLRDAILTEVQVAGNHAVVDTKTIKGLEGERIGLYLVRYGEDWYVDSRFVYQGYDPTASVTQMPSGPSGPPGPLLPVPTATS